MKDGRYDVVVAGGGTAGTAAAVAAAAAGCKVLLVEEANALGGCSTTGLVNEWFAHTAGLGDIFAQVHRELSRAGLSCGGRIFNGEILKGLWLTLCLKAGVETLLHASVVEAARSRRQVTGVKMAACGKIIEATADYFVDATGEGDLACLAGAEFMKGRPEDGRQFHMSLIFQMVKSPRPVEPWLPEGMEPYRSLEETPGLRVCPLLEDGRVYCNMTKVMGRDATDPWDLTAAENEARIQMLRTVHLLQSTTYKDYIPVASGATIGIREGRRVVGDYVLRAEDMLAGRSFEDGTVVATSQIDFHSLTKAGDSGWRQKVKPYGIPFRCLYSKDFDNLLMAGKCVSVDQVVHSSCRMTPTCCGMGQTVGIAAALAVKNRLADIRAVDARQLREEMARHGFELSPEKHQPFHIGPGTAFEE